MKFWKVLLFVGFTSLNLSVATAGLIITEVMSNSAHPAGTSNGDWFELTNNGSSTVSIAGWSWDDDTALAGSANFGGLTSIGAGQSIIVSSETIGQELAWRNDWNVSVTVPVINLGNSVVFAATGDQINIFDATNTIVTSVSFGASTQGFSFEWDRFGNSLGLSVIGENGAYRASSNGAAAAGLDVGSPGISAVPEPSSLVLLSLVGLGSFAARRYRKDRWRNTC